jgi:hypothetical protein
MHSKEQMAVFLTRISKPTKRRRQHPIGQCALLSCLLTIMVLYAAIMINVSVTEEPVEEFDVSKPITMNQRRHPVPPAAKDVRIPRQKHRAPATATAAKQIETDGILKAYLEEIRQEDWDVKPLPRRHAANLTIRSFPRLNNCSRLPELFPIDDYPDADPFLPWIHDVFPTHDGRLIQFVAQNKRRCKTGTSDLETKVLKHMQPQIALFQHVAVKRIQWNGETRYQLSSHEEADSDGMVTRFICRFKPSGEETLSAFNVHYEYAAWRKKHQHMFTVQGRDNKDIVTSQLLFQCPVPDHLQEIVRSGESVKNDWATLFVDVVPIRTPPRYGAPNRFSPPWYREQQTPTDPWNVKKEWGTHILPRTDMSGRWENIPICKPSLMTYKPQYQGNQLEMAYSKEKPVEPQKIHRLAVCTWTSAGYSTRGSRFQVNDGQRRMREWIHFSLMVGVGHFYIYDNSGAFELDTSLQPIADMFPDRVTIIPWPARVCNNNPNNVDSCGERSSQYAAESSCRLRFGPYMDWLGAYDIDEYLVPMGTYNSLLPLLDTLEKEGKHMINFNSWRAWPRRQLIETPVPKTDTKKDCSSSRTCFDVIVPGNRTIIQTYNCDRQKGPKKDTMPAEKQLYRPDYVKLHFVHYSTVTALSALNRSEFKKATKHKWRIPMTKDPNARFSDELTEGTMLHTKAMATQDTAGWNDVCTGETRGTCRIGNPYPADALEKNISKDQEGWLYNCFVNDKIEGYYLPLLEEKMKETEEKWNQWTARVRLLTD